MNDKILTLDRVGKRYVNWGSNTKQFLSWFGVPVEPKSEFWATKDVSITVHTGEAIAFVGQNGAGKSTLLHMIAGTVRPTVGELHVQGRVSAILELGLGFNPEFTGRENVFRAGGLMGYTRKQLEELLPSIQEFAEIGHFFNEPLRVYSSGMQARLAFALATATRPDLLIVDEVLSVGDSYFQHKSFDRIRKFKNEGTAILLVTHSLSDVCALCDRALLLDKGTVIKDASPPEIVNYYNALIAAQDSDRLRIEQMRGEDAWRQTRSGTADVIAKSIKLLNRKNNETISTAFVGQDLTITLVAYAKTSIKNLVLGIMLRDRTGNVIWASNTWHTHQTLTDIKAGEEVCFELNFPCNIGPGSYSITYSLSSSDTHLEDNYEWFDNVIVFEVENTSIPFFSGAVNLGAEFSVKRVQA